jgi:hypothetical protein
MIQLRVHQVNQIASGGSYVVIFDAELRMNESRVVTVEVCSVEPPDTDVELVEAAKQGILRGAEHVLRPLAKGASISVNRLVVNPVDFKPNRFTLYTAQELKRLVGK